MIAVVFLFFFLLFFPPLDGDVKCGFANDMGLQCADITFRANASTHQCTNSSGIVAQIVDEEETDSADNDDNDTNTAAVSTASSLLLGVLVLAVICATV